MACLITSGRIEPCKDSLGGLRNVYFINEDINTANLIYYNPASPPPIVDTDDIYYVQNIASLYKFELKSNENVYDQEIVTSRENGTTFFRQTLTIKLKKQDIATHNAVKTLAMLAVADTPSERLPHHKSLRKLGSKSKKT